jgi:alkylation response protein AidB-like acyl-CoA dehydrogenase
MSMYGFEPNEEQQMLVEAIGRYAANDLQPGAHDADEEGGWAPDVIEKGWQLGVLQASLPEAFGGFGEHSAVTGALAAEALAYGDLAGALAVMSPSAFALPILMAGSDEQKATWLPQVVEAEWKPYTAAVVEPSFNFTPTDLRTTALKDGDGYTLTGEKIYVPFADQAPALLVYANLDGQTEAFIVPGAAEGLTIGERDQLLGIHALPTFHIGLQNVHVEAAARLGGGEPGMTLPLAASQVGTAAMAVGMSQAAHEYALAYAKDREAFGKAIAQKQSIAFMLAEMAIEIEAIRLMVWEAAWQLDQGLDEAPKSAYLALIGAADMAMMVTDRAVQILGGHGYIREHPVERWMRNGRGVANLVGLTLV